MTEREFSKIIKEIQKTLKKMKNVKNYNLSGTAWQDYASSSERSRLYDYNDYNDYAEKKRDKYKAIIKKLLSVLMDYGCSKEKILPNFIDADDKDEIAEIINGIISKKESKKI